MAQGLSLRGFGEKWLGDWVERGVQAGGVCSSRSEMEGVCVRNTGRQQQKRNLEVGTVERDRCVGQKGRGGVYGVVGEV